MEWISLKYVKRNLLTSGLLLIIILIGFGVRYDQYATVPFPGDSRDEYSNTWVGMSLLQTGMPVGFSGIDGYENQKWAYINVDNVYQTIDNGTPFAINWPWFDHPPLTGLVTGGYATLLGIKQFDQTAIYIIRRPMVVLGTLSIFLVFIYGSMLYGKRVGLLASTFYAVSPLVVVGSRMIQAENLLIPIMLTGLISLVAFEKSHKEHWLWIGAIMIALGLLVKLSGIGFFLAGIILLLSNHSMDWRERVRHLIIYVPVGISGFILFVMYGFVIDWNQFLRTLASNSGRIYGIGPEALSDMILRSKVTNTRTLTDGWVLAGWLSFAGLFQQFERHRYILVPVLCYILTLLFFGSHPFGWYRFPLWPLFMIGIAYWVERTWFDWKNGWGLFISFVTLGLLLRNVIGINNFQSFVSLWKLLVLPLFGLFLLPLWSKHLSTTWMNRLMRVALTLTVIGCIVLSIRYTNSLTAETWYFSN